MGIRRQDFHIHAAIQPSFSRPGHEPVQPGQRWQPWPAHPAYADEVTRWWPSDEKLVNATPAPMACNRESDLVFIPVLVKGALLNLSA
jgi:hypothetical protein